MSELKVGAIVELNYENYMWAGNWRGVKSRVIRLDTDGSPIIEVISIPPGASRYAPEIGIITGTGVNNPKAYTIFSRKSHLPPWW